MSCMCFITVTCMCTFLLYMCVLLLLQALFCIVNPRRACAARVTVLGLSMCLSVCLSTLILALQATRRPMSYTNGFRSTSAGIIKRRFPCNGCVREIWRENKRKSQYDNDYSLTAALLQRPLARCFDDRGF